MTGLPLLLLLAALPTIDGAAALRHAGALAALGPHPFGSPRAQAAASYVAASFRDAGLDEVRLHAFDVDGRGGQNVIGVLRGSGPEFLVIGAHHDSVPEAPGAYDDGGGVGVLIETARALAKAGKRQRTLVFISFDGEEYVSAAGARAVGSRAWLKSLGAEARSLVAALAIEMCGQPGGEPVVHPLAYPDPLRSGGSVIAPAWLVRAALDGSRSAGAGFALGDPLLSLLYQPGVRAFRVGLYGDDLTFAQAGVPALLVSDSSFTRFYPHYHLPSDTADRLDGAALARTGRAVLGATVALSTAPLSRQADPTWLVVFGRVFGVAIIAAVALASIVPLVARGLGASGTRLAAVLACAAAFGVLMWRHPVVALFCLAMPNLAAPLVRGKAWLLSFLPGLLLGGLGLSAWLRPAGPDGRLVSGLWLGPLDLGLFVLAVVTLWLSRGPQRSSGRKASSSPKRKRK